MTPCAHARAPAHTLHSLCEDNGDDDDTRKKSRKPASSSTVSDDHQKIFVMPIWDEARYNRNIAKGLGGVETKPKSRSRRKQKHPSAIKPSSLNHQRLLSYKIKEALLHVVDGMPYMKDHLLGKGS